MTDTSTDEIDLIDLALVFWRDKFVILGLVGLSVAGGASYLAMSPEVYRVSSQATVNVYVPVNQQICAFDTKCWTRLSFDPIKRNIGPGWSVSETGSVSLQTTSPSEVGVYAAQLDEAAQRTNQAVLESARLELKAIADLATTQMAATDVVALQNLNAARAIEVIEGGGDAITFSPPVIGKIAPRQNVILAASLFIGLFLGMGVALVRNSLRKRQRSTDAA